MKVLLMSSVVLLCMISCNTTKNTTSGKKLSALRGSWQLNYISGTRIAFDGLYPNKKPVITFETGKNKISGNTSCNFFSGTFGGDENSLKIDDKLVTTKMACDGDGETMFVQALKKINSFDVT